MQLKQGKESIDAAVMASLQYFQLFRHPLYIEEIQKFLEKDIAIGELYDVLNHMVNAGQIYMHGSFYMLEDKPEMVTERLEGKERADKLIDHEAVRSAKLVSRFPFVKCVCISGSLSKGYANAKSDIDLFIITDKNRLWICRTILHFFKKMTFLQGRQNAFCMNYFIDESKLCIEEQNRFTATELATLIPMYNPVVYNKLIDDNKCWLVNTFPNVNWNKEKHFTDAPRKGIRVMLEPLLNLMFPKQLNLLLMGLTDKWWRLKWKRKEFPMQDYDLAMKTKWYVSKNHPKNYQKTILRKLKAPAAMAMSTAVG